MRSAVPATKRLAIVLHWLAHVPSFSQLATLYYLGKSTIISIVHQGIDIRERLTPNAILFPMASELKQVMVDFEALCGLPNCAGALDGIFIPIKKPEMFGDTYFCYKKFCAILLLGYMWMPEGFSHMLCWKTSISCCTHYHPECSARLFYLLGS